MDNKGNDLELDELGLVTSDFIKVADQLKIVALKIFEKKFSKFPIIIMSKSDVNFGTLFINKGEILKNKLNYYASYLELLTTKNIISNIDQFKKSYKNPKEFCCLLVVFRNYSKIIFIPYPED